MRASRPAESSRRSNQSANPQPFAESSDICLVNSYRRGNQGALDAYVPDDPRHAHGTVYYLGLQAEWWFNSSNYKH